MHERLNNVVLDVLGNVAGISDIGTGSNLNGIERLPGVGGIETTEVVKVSNHDVNINRISSGAVVDNGGSVVVLGVKQNSATAQGLKEESRAGAAGEGSLQNRVLGVLKGLGNDLELGKITFLDGLGSARREVLERGSIADLLSDLGDDLLVLRGDLGKGDVGGTVAHAKSVGAAGGTLTELSNSLGREGSVIGDIGLAGVGNID